MLAASFFVPPYASLDTAEATIDPRKEIQLNELERLREELAETEQDEELDRVLERLEDIERRYKDGSLDERDLGDRYA